MSARRAPAARGSASGSAEVPLSRRAGRAVGRWWGRHGADVRRISQPLRQRWAAGIAYAWFVAYMWIGLLLSVAGQRLTGTSSPYVLVAAVGGGGALGYWQARHRLRRHADPAVPGLVGFGVGLCAWLALIGVVLLATSR